MYMINKHKNSTSPKLSVLLQQKEQIFHTQDLAILWNISAKNTLYTTIKRYCQNGILFPIYKGLYSTVPFEKLDPQTLGAKALHHFAYVSCELILVQHGLLNRLVSEITFVSSKSSRFKIQEYYYRSRKLQDKFLFHPFGIFKENTVFVANKERAIADMLYFNSRMHFDASVDWKKIQEIQKIIGYPLTPKRYVDPAS